eukprot:scaffold86153_cov44-Cyclotella_meneghiniana.AAC.4
MNQCPSTGPWDLTTSTSDAVSVRGVIASYKEGKTRGTGQLYSGYSSKVCRSCFHYGIAHKLPIPLMYG